jgi:hypothetical protein
MDKIVNPGENCERAMKRIFSGVFFCSLRRQGSDRSGDIANGSRKLDKACQIRGELPRAFMSEQTGKDRLDERGGKRRRRAAWIVLK